MMQTQNIHYEETFKTTPGALYDLLLDAKRISEITGEPATMSKKVGGTFSELWFHGINLDMVPGERIVQAWRWENRNGEAGSWPEGHYSIVSYQLLPVKDGTKMIFDQIGVPAAYAEKLTHGWKAAHWDRIREMLSEKNAFRG